MRGWIRRSKSSAVLLSSPRVRAYVLVFIRPNAQLKPLCAEAIFLYPRFQASPRPNDDQGSSAETRQAGTEYLTFRGGAL